MSALSETVSPEVPAEGGSDRYLRGMEQLLHAVQELSLARDLPTVQRIVRRAARELTGCDGATFVLRDGPCCFYADEDAIEPLWKGRRFPLDSCISGWVMNHAQAVTIPDIYADPRIPHEAYRPTFVKSLVMAPIRRLDPIGAIGNYWADQRQPDEDEVRLLQALADATSVAMENVRVYSDLARLTLDQQSVIEQLRDANQALKELERERRQEEQRLRDLQEELLHVSRLSTMGEFASALSHELNQPLTAATTFLQVARRMVSGNGQPGDAPTLEEVVSMAATQLQRARDIIGSIRGFIRRGQGAQRAEDLNVSLQEASALTLAGMPDHGTDIHFDFEGDLPAVVMDKVQIQQVLVNLLRNALEAMRDSERRELTIRTARESDAELVVNIQDSGPGLAPRVREQLFRPFVSTKDTGMGLGLSLCQSIIQSHGGRIWAEAATSGGTVFSFTIPLAGVQH